MSVYRARRSYAPDSAEQHRTWLSLIEVSGPFLSLPVLRSTWPTLDALDKPIRERLRLEHTTWQADPVAGHKAWIDYVLRDLLGWSDTLHTQDLDALAMDVPEHDTRIVPMFALVEPGEDVKQSTTRLLGTVCEPGTQPTARITGEAWAATPADRLAQLCRHIPVVVLPGELYVTESPLRRTSAEILSLKVADIAMGSAAFLAPLPGTWVTS